MLVLLTRTLDTIHDFSVWLGIGSYPAVINRFQRQTGKYPYCRIDALLEMSATNFYKVEVKL